MKILKLCVAVVSLTIAILFCMYLNLAGDDCHEMNSKPTDEMLSIDDTSQLPVNNQEEVLVNEIITIETLAREIDLSSIKTATPTPSSTYAPVSTGNQPKGTFAEITIKTDKKTGSYTVMPDVYENTLKHNIGWLPSSSMPGGDGICVFMGHRDTDFRILQYLNTGDEIIVEQQNSKFIYKVYKIEILNSDSELRFDALPDSSLVLVTCYPFRYAGHAPKKFVVNCIIDSRQ